MTAPKGSRVQSAKARCRHCQVPFYKNLHAFEYYRIAIASWIGDGGNGYGVFAQNRRNLERGIPSFQVLREYVVKCSPIVNRIDGRIQVIA